MYNFSTDIRNLYPSLSLKVRCQSEISSDEYFHLACAGTQVEVDAASPYLANFALSQLLHALQAQRTGDIIGTNHPLYSIRALWITSGDWYVLPDGIKLFLPAWFVQGDLLSQKIKSAITFGINLLIFADQSRSCREAKPLAAEILERSLEEIQASGLKIALQVPPLKYHVKQFVNSCVQYLFFYQGDLFASGYKSTQMDLTSFERASVELKVLQESTLLPIIYHTDAACDYLLALSHAVRSRSVISFSALKQDSLNPIYSELSKRAVSEKTRLLSTIALSDIELEDGGQLVEMPLDRIENILGRNLNGRFCGAAVTASELGAISELSMCPLWIVGQRMWQPLNVHALFESWLDRFHPEWHLLFQKKGFLDLFSELFFLLRNEEVELASQMLAKLGQALLSFKEERRFQNKIPGLVELSNLLFQFQKALKRELEGLSSKKVTKIPLVLQNFQPIQF